MIQATIRATDAMIVRVSLTAPSRVESCQMVELMVR